MSERLYEIVDKIKEIELMLCEINNITPTKTSVDKVTGKHWKSVQDALDTIIDVADEIIECRSDLSFNNDKMGLYIANIVINALLVAVFYKCDIENALNTTLVVRRDLLQRRLGKIQYEKDVTEQILEKVDKFTS